MGKKFSTKIPHSGRPVRTGESVVKLLVSFWQRPVGTILLCLVLFSLTLWAFFPSLQSGFMNFDERGELVMNKHMGGQLDWNHLRWAFTSLEYSNWYPLTWISDMLDFKFYGSNPWGHHLTNVLLHAANGVLLFLALKRLTGAFWRSLMVAAIFALHPLRVESVAWLSERKDVLSAFFGLLTLWAYAHHATTPKAADGKSGRWSFLSSPFYWLCLFFFACGLMSKAMLVTFPCLFLLLDYWPLQRIRKSGFEIGNFTNLLLEKTPFILLIVPLSMVVYAAQKVGGQFLLHFPLGFRLETALMGYARYLGKMVWPANLSVLYPYPNHWPTGELLPAGAVLLGMSALAVILRRARPYLLVGWFWYLGMLVPVIGLIPLGAQSMSNRYTYLPMIGILLVLVWVAYDLTKSWRWQTYAAAAVVVAVLGLSLWRTRAELVYWKTDETLWRRALAVTQNNFMAHYCLATVLWAKDLNQATVEYQKCVDIYPAYEDAERELGICLVRQGHFSEAIAPLQRATQLNPKDGWAFHDWGVALYHSGRTSDYVPYLLKAVELNPLNPNPMETVRVSHLLDNPDPNIINNILEVARSDPAGFGTFMDALNSDTNSAGLNSNLAFYFASYPDPGLRNGKYAVRLAKRACEMTGYQETACVGTLAAAYAEDSQFDMAVSMAQKACNLATEHGEKGLLQTNQKLLNLYRSHQTYHEIPGQK